MKNLFKILIILFINYNVSICCEDVILESPEQQVAKELSLHIINAIHNDSNNYLELLFLEYAKIDAKKCQTDANILAEIINKEAINAAKLFFNHIDFTYQIIKDSALIISIRKNNLELAKILIENGANVNATQNLNGNKVFTDCPPIAWAIQIKNLDIINLLLKSGANISDLFIVHSN